MSSNIKKQIERGINILQEGGIVAFPTDTIYGLGACLDSPEAIARIYVVKQRPVNMALPLLLANISQLEKVAINIPPVARSLACKFWPGALTLVLFKSSLVPDIVTAGGKTVAVRVPAHPIPIALIEGAGVPIVGTSANLSGKPNPLTAADVHAQLGDKVDLIIDGGRCTGGTESTIVDLTGERPEILREGAIAREELEKVWG